MQFSERVVRGCFEMGWTGVYISVLPIPPPHHLEGGDLLDGKRGCHLGVGITTFAFRVHNLEPRKGRFIHAPI